MLGALLEDSTFKIVKKPRRRAHLEVKIVKTLHARSTFDDSWFSKLARCLRAKQIFKIKSCTKIKTAILLAFRATFRRCHMIMKIGTPPAREAHSHVRSRKNSWFLTSFESCMSEKVHAARARSIFSSKCVKTQHVLTLLEHRRQKQENTCFSRHFSWFM